MNKKEYDYGAPNTEDSCVWEHFEALKHNLLY